MPIAKQVHIIGEYTIFVLCCFCFYIGSNGKDNQDRELMDRHLAKFGL